MKLAIVAAICSAFRMPTMHRLALALAAVLALAPEVGAAKNPCKATCRLTKRACVTPANVVFAAAKIACRTLPAGLERKSCLGAARGVRATARAACKEAHTRCLGSCGGGGGTPQGRCGSNAPDWLATVNLFRGLANLPSVTERAEWSAGALAHATYTAQEDTIGHSENPASPYYSADGVAAAQASNVAGHSSPTQGYGWAIDAWMTGPFHAIGIIDPRLAETWLHAAIVSAAVGDRTKAENELKEALRLDPTLEQRDDTRKLRERISALPLPK